VAALQELALFHEPYWRHYESDSVKSLLLFFEGIALLVPNYMSERPFIEDPALAEALADQGLLRILSPETLVDSEITQSLADLFERLFSAGAFDRLDRNRPLLALSGSRLGLTADPAVMTPLLDELTARGLANHSQDGVSVPIHEDIRALVLATLGQLLRRPGEALGYSLQPLGQEPRFVRALMNTLDSAPMPTAGRVVTSDLAEVTLDLTSVPLEDVLEFRAEHGKAYRAYARDLRAFVRDVANVDAGEVDSAFADRRDALKDAADELHRLARTAWRRPMAGFSLGISGAALGLATGNPVGAGIAFAGGLLGLKRQADPGSAYIYLFEAHRRWSAGY